MVAGFLERLPATLQFYEKEGVTVNRDTPVFIRLGPSGWKLDVDHKPEDYGCRYRRMSKFRSETNVGAKATPHSARNSGLTQDNRDGVSGEESKKRALIVRDTTLGGYQSLSRLRRGTGPMRARGAVAASKRTAAWSTSGYKRSRLLAPAAQMLSACAARCDGRGSALLTGMGRTLRLGERLLGCFDK
jgi:hypothetical protein